MKRWKLTIEYNGENFAGWQRQEDLPTVQGVIESAIYKFCQQEISITAAGRTDAGVHARGQVAHFDLDYGSRPLTGFELAKAINAHLRPQRITILRAEEVTDDFHARFHAVNKLYTYRIINRHMPLALDRDYAWHIKHKLDIEAMRAGAKFLIGQHDFTSFRASECQSKSPIKTLNRFDIETRPYDEYGGVEIFIHGEGRSFLHHQMRNMVGTLTLVGEGKWAPEDVQTALNAKNRAAGGPTAPAQGLSLIRIDYPI